MLLLNGYRVPPLCHTSSAQKGVSVVGKLCVYMWRADAWEPSGSAWGYISAALAAPHSVS